MTDWFKRGLRDGFLVSIVVFAGGVVFDFPLLWAVVTAVLSGGLNFGIPFVLERVFGNEERGAS